MCPRAAWVRVPQHAVRGEAGPLRAQPLWSWGRLHTAGTLQGGGFFLGKLVKRLTGQILGPSFYFVHLSVLIFWYTFGYL
jgi:hypothetical protein